MVRRVLFAVGLGLCTMVALLRLQTYQNEVAQAEQLTLDALRNAAWTAAQQIDGDAHRRLAARYKKRDAILATHDDADYAIIHKQLSKVYEALALSSPVYTYVPCPAGRASTHEFVVTSSAEPYFRHSFTSLTKSQQKDFGSPGELGVYEDEYGSWLSAFAPVHDSTGEVVAMVQVDEPFDLFIATARARASEGLHWDLLILILVLGGLGRFFSQLLHRERRQKEQLASAVSEQTRLSVELSKREAQLKEKAGQLEASNRDLTDFANIASHDLKSPLRGITSFAQLLARRNRATLDESSNEYLDYILSNSRRALKLVDGLLTYAKADQQLGDFTNFSLRTVVEDAVDNLRVTLTDRKAVVVIDKLQEGTGDRSLLTQVFQNLIANGIKYNRNAKPTVHVDSFLDANDTVIFQVRDNGIGIPAEHQAQVFDMFRRLHGGDEFEGSGIGLAFCARVIGRYGGTIWLESTEGEGSTFFFTLPAAVRHTADLKAQEAIPV